MNKISDEPSDKLKKALFDEMHLESDRGCILVGASVLEELLELALKEILSKDAHVVKHAIEPLFGSMGPLSTFSAKIKLAYSLGVFDKWCFGDLEKIRKIRNAAAHDYSPKTFENKDVINITCTLVGADLAVSAFPKNENEDSHRIKKKNSKSKPIKPISKERVRFVFTVNYIAGFLDSFVTSRRKTPSGQSLTQVKSLGKAKGSTR